jgi:hypothetical protein
MMAAAFSACGHRASTANGAEADSTGIDSTETVEAKPQVPALQTDTISKEKTDEKAEVVVSVAWPTDGDSALVSAVRAYICKTLGIGKTNDGKAAVKKAFQEYYTETAAMWEDVYMSEPEDNEGEAAEDYEEQAAAHRGPCFSYMIYINKVADTDKFVTYMTDVHTYSGGAHGSSSCVGITFSKATTKTLGYETVMNDKDFTTSIKGQTLFNDKVKTKEFNKLLKEGLKGYFKDVDTNLKEPISDAELSDMLMDQDLSTLSLPSAPPHFTDNGLEFIYQQYEIAAYCYGMPSFCIPYDKIKPYLSDEAKTMVP